MINLLPPEIKNERKLSGIQRKIITYGFSLVCFGLLAIGIKSLGYLITNKDRDNVNTQIESKKSELEAINQDQQEAIDISKDIETIGLLLDRSINFSEIIQEIGSVLPTGAVLTGLALNSENTENINMVFNIDSQRKAAVVRKNLEDSEIFAGADLVNISGGLPTDNDDNRSNGLNFSTSIVTKFSDSFLERNLDGEEPEESGSEENNAQDALEEGQAAIDTLAESEDESEE